MRFLADESCDSAVVRALQGAGHEVLVVSEFCPGADDQAVINLAVREERILLTRTKILVSWSMPIGCKCGVILLRFPAKQDQQSRGSCWMS